MRHNHNGSRFNPFVFLKNKTNLRRAVAVLASIVVFVSTYAMILPAIALEKNNSAQDDGIFLEEKLTEEAVADAEIAEEKDISEETQEGKTQEASSASDEDTTDESFPEESPENAEEEVKEQTAEETEEKPIEVSEEDPADEANEETADNPEKETVDESKEETADESEEIKEEQQEENTEKDKTENKEEETTAAPAEESAEEGAAEEESDAAADTEEYTEGKLEHKKESRRFILSYDAEAEIPSDALVDLEKVEEDEIDRDAVLEALELSDEEEAAEASYFVVRIYRYNEEGEQEEILAKAPVTYTFEYENDDFTLEEEESARVVAVWNEEEEADGEQEEVNDSDEEDGQILQSAEELDAEITVEEGIVREIEFEVDHENADKTVGMGLIIVKPAAEEIVESEEQDAETEENSADTEEELKGEGSDTEAGSEEVKDEMQEENAEKIEETSEELTGEQTEEQKASGEVAAASDAEKAAEEKEAAFSMDDKVLAAASGKKPGEDAEKKFTAAAGKAEVKEDDYTISVKFDKKAGLPKDTRLHVEDIDDSAEAYSDYYEKINAFVGEDATIQYAHFYDLTLNVGEEEIEPDGEVSVSMKYRMPDGVPEGADRYIVHFTKNGIEVMDHKPAKLPEEGKGLLKGTKKLFSRGINAVANFATGKTGSVETAEFKTDGFSTYGVIYTIDFEYVAEDKVYQFSMEGGKKILLSELADVLGLYKDTAFENAQAFAAEVDGVEFSDPALIKVAQIDGDWELESLQPFDTKEKLTITLKNGDVVTVKVTDEQETLKVTKKWLASDGLTDISNAVDTDTVYFKLVANYNDNSSNQAQIGKVFSIERIDGVWESVDLGQLNNDPLGWGSNSFKGYYIVETDSSGNEVNNGSLVTYTIDDTEVSFTNPFSYDAAGTLTITNTAEETTGEIEVVKNWEGEFSEAEKNATVRLKGKKSNTPAIVRIIDQYDGSREYRSIDKYSDGTPLLVGDTVNLEAAYQDYINPCDPIQLKNGKASFKISDSETIIFVQTNGITSHTITRSATGENEITVSPDVTLNASNGWYHKWTDLPAGYSYTVEEVDPAPGIEVAYSYNGAEMPENGISKGLITVTNTKSSTQISVTADKKWAHADGTTVWPANAEVEVTLYQSIGDGEKEKVTFSADSVVSNPVTLTSDNSSVTWENLPRKSGEDTITYTVEETAVNGFDMEEKGYFCAVNQTSPGRIILTNTQYQGVKLNKLWGSHVSDDMAWEATFILEELEYPYAEQNGHVTYDAQAAHDDPDYADNWKEVSPRREWTVRSDDPSSMILNDLPKFRVKNDGKTYILMYSVTETGYIVWSDSSKSNVLYSWSDADGYTGEVHFTPEYHEDADEVTNYEIEVINSERNEKEDVYIDFDLKKTWEPEEQDDYYAVFQLKRMQHQEFKKLDDRAVDYSQFVTVRLVDIAGRELSRLQVEKNAQIKLQAGFKTGLDGVGTVDFFNTDGTTGHVIMTNGSVLSSQTLIASQPFRVNHDATFQYVSGEDYLADGLYGVIISDRCDGAPTADKDDDVFNNNNYRYRVDKNTGHIVSYSNGELLDETDTNGWTVAFNDLPQTVVDSGTTQEITTVYGYYFEEVESNPEWETTFYQADNTGKKTNTIKGDTDNRIYFNDHVIAENKKTHLTIKKYWESLIQSEMPNIVVEIGRKELDSFNNYNYPNNQSDYTRYKRVILTADNNFEYDLFDLPTQGPNGNYVYAPFELGITTSKPGDDGVAADGTILDDQKVILVPIDSNKFEKPSYIMAKDGVAINYAHIKQKNGYTTKSTLNECDYKTDIIQTGTGTICIVNIPKKFEPQMDVRKRWHKFTTEGGMTTESNYNGAYLTLMLVQIVKDAETHDEIKRLDYGVPFEWHYDSQGGFYYYEAEHEGNITVSYKEPWHVNIKEGTGSDGSNLPITGYYTTSNGEVRPAEYDYTVREVSVTSTDGYHWAISDHIGPQSQTDTSGHQFFLDNYPDADLKIIKHWPTKETHKGATAVYFKITDSNGKNVLEKIVAEKSYREHQITAGDVAQYNGVWCLVVRGEINSTSDWIGYIDHLPLFDFTHTVFGDGGIAPGGMPGEINYNVEEVAARIGNSLVPSKDLYIPYYQVTTRGTKGSIRTNANGIQLGMYDTIDGREVLQPTIVEVTNNAAIDLKVEKRFFKIGDDGAAAQVDPSEQLDWITEDGAPVSQIDYIVKVDTLIGDATTPDPNRSGYLTANWKTGEALAQSESGAKIFTLNINNDNKLEEDSGPYWHDEPEELKGLPTVKIVPREGQEALVYRYEYSIIEKEVKASIDEVESFSKSQEYDRENGVYKLSNTRTKVEFTDFEFTKEWQNQSSDRAEDWPQGKAIEIEVFRTANGETDNTFLLAYTITSSNYNQVEGIGPDDGSKSPEGTSPVLKYVANTKYKFKVDSLLKKAEDVEYQYFVKETNTIDGYQSAKYYQLSDEGQLIEMATGSANGDHTNDGGKIVNKENTGVTLPLTGGPGTHLFTILGSILVAGAGILLFKGRNLI